MTCSTSKPRITLVHPPQLNAPYSRLDRGGQMSGNRSILKRYGAYTTALLIGALSLTLGCEEEPSSGQTLIIEADQFAKQDAFIYTPPSMRDLAITNVCGDFILAGEEECDDGNLTSGDGCDSSCRVERCGNGVLDVGEQCDDGEGEMGNSDSEPNRCRRSCRFAVCGDGVVDFDEQCDDGQFDQRGACLPGCVSARCGDGFLRTDLNAGEEGYEECDEGYIDNQPNACRVNCKHPTCGDGIQDRGEECDDGDEDETDECLSTCERARCGDGILRTDIDEGQSGYEECDDGNTIDSDVCSSQCVVKEIGVTILCGNGVLDLGEECDDGGSNADDSACTTSCRVARCGDGILRADLNEGEDGYEACEPSLFESTPCRYNQECDRCTPTCQIETTLLGYCGDGVINPPFEECDGGDGCIDCQLQTACGDGVISVDEECDDGNLYDGDGCTFNCIRECNNGTIEGGEECDGDADCDLTCTLFSYVLTQGQSVLSGHLDLDDGYGQDEYQFTVDDDSSLEVCLSSASIGRSLSLTVRSLNDEIDDPLQTEISGNSRCFTTGEERLPTGEYILEVSVTDTPTPNQDESGLYESLFLSYHLSFSLTQDISEGISYHGQVSTGGDDTYRLELDHPTMVHLRVSPDGLGGCHFEGLGDLRRAPNLDLLNGRPQLQVFKLTEDQLPVLFAQENPTSIEDPHSCSLYTSADYWESGVYLVKVRGVSQKSTLPYVLDVAFARNCQEAPLDPQRPDQESCDELEAVWLKETATERRRVSRSLEPDEYRFYGKPNITFKTHEPPIKAKVVASIYGCVDGPNVSLEMRELLTNASGDIRTYEPLRSVISSGTSQDSDGATPCVVFESEVDDRPYVLQILGEDGPLAQLPNGDGEAAPFPYEIEMSLLHPLDRGGEITSILHPYHFKPSSGLEMAEDVYTLNFETDSFRTVDLQLTNEADECLDIELSGPSLKTQVSLTDHELTSADFKAPTVEGDDDAQAIALRDFVHQWNFVAAQFPPNEVANTSGDGPCLTRRLILSPGGYQLRVRSTSDPLPTDDIEYTLKAQLLDLCGNDKIDGGEACDDGNLDDGDTCSSLCQDQAECGNNILEDHLGEECDDGNFDQFDGCSSSCTICGNGVVSPANEECDEGLENGPNSALCDAFCTLKTRAVTTLQRDELFGSVGLGEKDTYTLPTIDGQTWIEAYTTGCNNTQSLLDTTLGLYMADTLKAENENTPTTLCSRILRYIETDSADLSVTVEGHERNELPEYGLVLHQTRRLLLDKSGLCNQSNVTSAPDSLQNHDPITSCDDRGGDPIATDSSEGIEYNNVQYLGVDELEETHTYNITALNSGRLSFNIKDITSSHSAPLDRCPLQVSILFRGDTTQVSPQDAVDPQDLDDLCQFSELSNHLYTKGLHRILIQLDRSLLDEGATFSYSIEFSPADSVCGDGVVEFDEECDLGCGSNNESEICQLDRVGEDFFILAGCRDRGANACTTQRCGDSSVDSSVGEECDDGNEDDQDGCLSSGTSPETECVSARCGDGVLRLGLASGDDGYEECDTGALNSDRRPNACRHSCTRARCGDDVIDSGEECDDGNDDPNDQCHECQRMKRCDDVWIDEDAVCEGGDCGNEILDTDLGEECDDGNREVEQCVYGETECIVCGVECTEVRGRAQYCGDGEIQDGLETCDDGNTISDDGCSATCVKERYKVHVSRYERTSDVQETVHLYELFAHERTELKIEIADLNGNDCVNNDTTIKLYALNEEGLIAGEVGYNDDKNLDTKCSYLKKTLYAQGSYLIEVSSFNGSPLQQYSLRTHLYHVFENGLDRLPQSVGPDGDIEYSFDRDMFDGKQIEFILTEGFGSYQLSYLCEQETPESVPITQLQDVATLSLGQTRIYQVPDGCAHQQFVRVTPSDQDPFTLSLSPRCGDGVWEEALKEECDDGNQFSGLGDTCDYQCRIHRQDIPNGVGNVCGNGILEDGEACDSGHLLDLTEIGEARWLNKNVTDPLVTHNRLHGLINFRETFRDGDALIFQRLKVEDGQTLPDYSDEANTIIFTGAYDEDDNDSLGFYVFNNLGEIEKEDSIKRLVEIVNRHFNDDDPETYKVTASSRGDQLRLLIDPVKFGSNLIDIEFQTPGREAHLVRTVRAPTPICDSLCSFKSQRLVSNTPPEVNDARYSATPIEQTIQGEQIPERGEDQYFFDIDYPSDAIFTIQRGQGESTDTVMRLYIVDSYDERTLIAENDDADQLLQPDDLEELGSLLKFSDEFSDEAHADYESDYLPSLSPGSYVLVISGVSSNKVDQYRLKFSISQILTQDQDATWTTDLVRTFWYGSFPYDEFKDVYGTVSVKVNYDFQSSTPNLSNDVQTQVNANPDSTDFLDTLDGAIGRFYALHDLTNNAQLDKTSAQHVISYCDNDGASCANLQNCGNATVDAHEVCDDSDLLNKNACTNLCSPQKPYDVKRYGPTDDVVTNSPISDETLSYTDIAMRDDYTVHLPGALPAGFKFFAETPSDIYVSSNGFLSFVNRGSGCCSGRRIPSRDYINGVIAGYWSDLFPKYFPQYANIYSVYTDDSSRNTIKYHLDPDHLIVKWDDVDHYYIGTPVTFKIMLNKLDSSVTIYCKNCISNGRPHTQGLESTSGDLAAQYEVGGRPVRSARSWSATEDIIKFTPNCDWEPWDSNLCP